MSDLIVLRVDHPSHRDPIKDSIGSVQTWTPTEMSLEDGALDPDSQLGFN